MLDKFSPRYKVTVLAVIAIARIVYSLNWYTLSPGLSQVETTFHASLQSLGILESAFLAGAGFIPGPAAYAAARWNAKILIISGLSVIALANGLASFAPSLVILTLLRFFLGIGAAMFFSPRLLSWPHFQERKARFGSRHLQLCLQYRRGDRAPRLGLRSRNLRLEDWALDWRGARRSVDIVAHSRNPAPMKKISGRCQPFPRRRSSNVLKKQTNLVHGCRHHRNLVCIIRYFPVSSIFETTVNFLNPALCWSFASLILMHPDTRVDTWRLASDKLRNRKRFMLYPTIVFGLGTALIGILKFDESLILLSMLGLLQSFSFRFYVRCSIPDGRVEG